MKKPRILLTLVLCACVVTASAQALYRCGNTFSERSCGADAKVLIAPPEQKRAATAPVNIPPPAAQIEANSAACERQTRAGMKDPESARIKLITRSGPIWQRYKGEDFYAVAYHMNVNAKNSYGGYTGEKLYLCAFAMDETTWLYSREIAPW